LYALSTKLPPTQDSYAKSFVDFIMTNKWSKVLQLDEAIEFIKAKLASVGGNYVIDDHEFSVATGVGINVSETECQKLIDDAFNLYKAEIDELKYDF
jgi:hypothetical protein